MYKTIYNKLVENGKQNKIFYKRGSLLERHHIIPHHAGGLDEQSNYTYLTRREHIIAHYLLWRIYRRNGDRWALCKMSGAKVDNRGEKNPGYGKPLSEEHKAKLRKKRTPETRKLMSENRIGKGNNFYGRKHTAESIALMHRIIECPHCKKQGNIGNMKRWHFKNCKSC
jgi:hypothetical protein